jgi:hypothetical protein
LHSPVVQKPARDHRLDLARGVMLLIIFVAHVPNNLWADWIPARFGFSSGAEIFVFVSGVASGLAFGGTFLRKGFPAGVRRIGKRILQLYGAHLGALVLLGGLALALDHATGGQILAIRYGLDYLRDNPVSGLVAYATLHYVPPFFDILPMYVILLALVVPAMALARIAPWAVLALSALVWLVMQVSPLHFSAHPLIEAPWYFNPFAWQFLFFLGFAFGVRWLKAPPRGLPWLFWTSVAYLAAAVPLTFWGLHGMFPYVDEIHAAIYPDGAITVLAPARLLHFLALAYVSYSLVDPAAAWLASPRLAPLYRVGRNSFGCFLAGLALSMLGGIAIDWFGMTWAVAHVVNIAGLALLLAAGWALDRRGGKGAPKPRSEPLPVSDHRREPATVG